METITLNNGLIIPKIGLGTGRMTQDVLINAVHEATKMNYRLFDTSPNYHNDISLGIAINSDKLNRSNFIISSKVDNTEQKNNTVRNAFEDILKRMNIEYLDLYLMHWPYPDKFKNTWREMEKIYDEGLVRAIGVCNFCEHHFKALFQSANIIPAINQIELHPLFSQSKTVNFCKQNKIQIMSYSPLARMDKNLIENPNLIKLSKKYNKTVVQIILRWNIELDYITIPKTSTFKRIHENIDIFDFTLSDEEINLINNLNRDYRIRFDPDDMSRYK